MVKSKISSRLQSYQTERLSKIPTMASAISKIIDSFKEQNRKLVEDAIYFFASYKDERSTLQELKNDLVRQNSHISVIEKYKKDHGKLPKIKGQESTGKFLQSLYVASDKGKKQFNELQQKMQLEKVKRYENLDHLADNMLDLLDGPKIFSQFLGTIALSTPLPEEKVRCVRNEKYKPIYIAALTVALFDKVRCYFDFESDYLKHYISSIFLGKYKSLDMHDPQLPEEIKIAYRNEILKPIAKAALIQFIGSYSPEAEAIFDGDRYRALTVPERDELIQVMSEKSIHYLKYAIGIPTKRFDKKEERESYQKYESTKLRFMLDILENHNNKQHELGNLIRIPMIYSSFIVSTKPEFEYQKIYEAYDIIEQGISYGNYRPLYAKLFLKIIGKFPVGSGIFFISNESGRIERAIVSSLYPRNVENPVCKQVTRNEIQALSKHEVIVSKATNVFYEDVRENSEFSDEFYQLRFNNEYTWNANTLWEVQIPAITFWKKEGTYKEN